MTLQAQDALAQAQKQRPAATLAIATLPLGKAFALSEGWAEARGVSAFRVQAHTRMVQELRPQLTQQLTQQGMPTGEVKCHSNLGPTDLQGIQTWDPSICRSADPVFDPRSVSPNPNPYPNPNPNQVFPVFMWEELTTDTVMPVFLSRAEIVATWQAVQKQR